MNTKLRIPMLMKFTVAEKRFAIAELRRRGQNPNNFKENGKLNLQKVWAWLRSRKSH